jgi:hypothetical protein
MFLDPPFLIENQLLTHLSLNYLCLRHFSELTFTPAVLKMILNTLTAHLVSSITPPNKTDMALKSSMPYLAAYLKVNQCLTEA